MNKIFRVIWSYVLKQFVVVNELTKSRSKEKSARAAVGVVSSTESAKFALRPAALVTAAAFAAFSAPLFAAESEGWLRLDEPAAAEAAMKESAYGRLPHITASSDFVRAARAESTNALERAVRTSADAADSRVVRAAYSPKQLALAAPRADVPAVVRNGKAVEGAQDGSFSFKDLKLEGKTPFGSDKAFDPYRWDNHKTEAGDVNGVDQTVHIGSGATSGGTNDRKWVTLKDEGWTAVASGNPGSKGNLTASDVLQDGGVVTIKDDAGNVITIDKDNAGDLESAFKNEFTLGGTDTVSFVDEVTGANRTANVWMPFSENNPDGFDESEYLPDEKFSRPDKSDIYDENGNRLGSGQYVDKVFFSVKGDGGLRVRVNDEDEAPEDFHAVLKVSGQDKYSTVFEAIDGGKISYESKTNVQLATDGDVSGGDNSIGWTHEYISYTGKKVADLDTLVYEKKDEDGNVVARETVAFNDAGRRAELENAGFSWDEGDPEKRIAFVVNNEETLIAFNEYLIGMLGKKTEDGSGSYDETWYQTEFRSAFTIGTEEWTAEFDPGSDFYVPPTDSTAKGSNQQQVSFIRAGRSKNADAGTDYGRVVIKDGAEITMTGSLASILRVDGEGHAYDAVIDESEAEAVIEKGGKLKVAGAYGWAVNSHGGLVWNEGTIEVGLQESGEGLQAEDGYGLVGVHLENGARFENREGGLVKYDAGSFGKAVEVESGSIFSNSGELNMITGTFRAPTKDDNYGIRQNFKRSSLVTVTGEKSKFFNNTGGRISLGTNGAETSEQPIDVFLIGEKGAFENAGTITTGEHVRNMNIVRLEGAGAEFTNTGNIYLNATKTSDGDESFNAVVQAGEGTQAFNYGLIELNGVNAVALQALEAESVFDSTGRPRVINYGTITVGAAQAGSAPNYAIWAEGTGTVAQNSGTINLSGDRAIGIHARNGADIEVTERASIVFDSEGNEATGQIAYLIYGSGENGDRTSIHDSTSSIENSHRVTADFSTYFRVDTGATLDLQSGFYDVASEGSSIITVTGEGARFTAENSSTDTLHLSVDGKDSAALLVTGGGYAYWGGNVDVSVTGENSAIAIISGEYIDVETNAPDPTRFMETFFDINEDARITGDQFKGEGTAEGNAVAFRVKSGGVLRNQGEINLDNLSDSNVTGVILEGGTLRNGVDGENNLYKDAAISVNGVAVEVRGASAGGDASTLENHGLIEATDGLAAVRLTQGATLELTNSTEGTITAGGSAHAVLIESDGQLTVDGAALSMKNNSHGNVIENRSENAVIVGAVDMTVRDGIGLHTETLESRNGGKTITIAGAAGEDGAYRTADGTGIAIEHIDSNVKTSVSDEAVEIGSDYTIKAEENNQGHGTGVLVNTAESATVNAKIRDLNVGVLVKEAESLTVGEANEQADITVAGKDAAGIRLDGRELDELAVNGNIRAISGTAVDLSTQSGEARKAIGSISLAGNIAGDAAGLDLSGSKLDSELKVEQGSSVSGGVGVNLTGAEIEGTVNIAGTVASTAQNGAALLLSGASAADEDSRIEINNTGTITNTHASATDETAVVFGDDMTAGVSFTNRGRVNGSVVFNNVSGSNVGHIVTVAERSSIAGNVETSTGDDVIVLDGIKESQADVFAKVDAGAGHDELRLNGSEWLVNSEKEQNRLVNFEQITLNGKSVFTIENDDYLPILGDFDGENAQYVVTNGSTLSLKAGQTKTETGDVSEGFVFSDAVEGTGSILVDGMNGAFAFGDIRVTNESGLTAEAKFTGEHFTGTLNLENVSTTYEWNTAAAFRQADVHIGDGASLTVGKYVVGDDIKWSQMGSLFLEEESSRLVYDKSARISISTERDGDRVTNSFTDSLYKVDLKGDDTELGFNGGTVSIQISTNPDFADGEENYHRVVKQTLMAQDEGSDDIRLVVADEDGFQVSGDLDNIKLELVREDGTLVTGAFDYALKSADNTAEIGKAYYEYGLSTSSLDWGGSDEGKDNGLYVSKQLVRLYLNEASQGDNLLHLSGVSSEKAVRGDEIHAHIYGNGGFFFAGLDDDLDGTGYVSNEHNAFGGEVDIRSGTLVATTSNALGGAEINSDGEYDYAASYSGDYASLLNIEDGAGFWLGKTSKDKLTQTIGALVTKETDSAKQAEVALNSGTLTIKPVDGETAHSVIAAADTLTGSKDSKLVLSSGTLEVIGDQAGFAGTAELQAESRTTIFAGKGLGTNKIEMKGSAALDISLDMTSADSFTLAADAKSTKDGEAVINVLGNEKDDLKKFAFGSGQSDEDFKGTLKLSNVGYAWNKDLLSSARLTSEAGSVVDVDGVRSVRALDIGDGTTFNFGELALGKFLNDNAIKVTGGGSGSGNKSDLTLPGTGESADFVVTAKNGTASGGKLNYQRDKDTLQGGVYSVLDLDDGAHFTALVDQKFGSETLDGSIRLVGEDGEAVSSVEVDLTQNGTAIADATFGFVNNGAAGGMGEVTISNGDLGVNYQLTALDIEDGQSVFVATTMETDTDNTLTARISEEEDSTKGGGLVFGKASDGASNEATIKNSDNRLTGAVELLEGMTLNVAASDSLGSDDTHTRKVVLGKGAVLRLGSDNNSVSQTVGAIAGGANDSTSTVDLAASSKLTIDGQTDSVFGILKGGKYASITLDAGDLTILSADEDLFDGEAFIGSTEGKTASLTVKKQHGLGTANVQIGANDRFVVDADDDDTLLNSMTGQGSVHFTGAGKTTLTAASDFTGGLYVEKCAVEAKDAGGVLAGAMLGKGDLYLTGGSLTVNTSADWDLESHGYLLTGSGTLNVVHEGDHQDDFTFAAGQTAQADPLFTGTLDLSNITIGFSGNTNKSVLSYASLVVNKYAQANFNETGVTFKTLGVKENGILDFSSMEAMIGTTTAENAVHADAFDFSGASGAKVRVDMADAFLNEIPEPEGPVAAASLLDQDNGDILLRLGVLNTQSSTPVDVSKIGLEIKNDKGGFDAASEAPYSLTVDITQSTAGGSVETVADGIYNLGLSGDETGWGIAHQLDEVSIYDGKTLRLLQGKDNALSAKIIEKGDALGGGSLAIHTGHSVRLTNQENSFSGDVKVENGATLTIVSGALGGKAENSKHADRVALEADASLVFDLDVDSVEQTVGSIQSAATSSIVLGDNGRFEFDDASEKSEIAGTISGGEASSLILKDGVKLDVAYQPTAGETNGFMGTTFVGSDAVLTLAESGSLGTGRITLEEDTSRLEMSSDSNWAMSNVVTGSGTVHFVGENVGQTDALPEFAFKAPGQDESFVGKLWVQNAVFALSGAGDESAAAVNESVMSKADLEIDSGRLILSDGKSEINSLRLSGSTISAGSVVYKQHSSGWLDMTQEGRDGVLTIDGENTLELTGIGSFGDESLLMQDEGGLSTVILAKDVVFENDGSVKLDMQDESGQTGGYVRIDGLQQGVAGIYGVGEISYKNGEQEGLFVEAKLYEAQVEKDAELLLSGTDIGVETADGTIVAPSADKSFSASITGEGGLRVEKTVYLDREQGVRDPSNSYDFVTDFTGATTIAEGATLVLLGDDLLGTAESHTSGIGLEKDADLWLQTDAEQHAGTLSAADGAVVHLLNGSKLVLDDKSASGVLEADSALTGTGTLAVDAGSLRIDGANADFSGLAQAGSGLADGAAFGGRIVLGNADGLGTADVLVNSDGKLVFDLKGVGGLENDLLGSGKVSAVAGTTVRIDRSAEGATEFKGTYHAQNGSTIVFAGDENFSALGRNEAGILEGAASAVVDKSGTIRVEHVFDSDDDKYWIFAQKVSGDGTLVLSTNRPSTGVTLDDVNNQIYFNKTAADWMTAEETKFSGTVLLENGRLRLQRTDQDNWTEAALKFATLKVGTGGRLMVSDPDVENNGDSGDQGPHAHEIHGLAFDGGTVRFGQETALITGADEQKPLLDLDVLDASGSGTVEINVGSATKLPDAGEFEDWLETHQSFMEQDDGRALIQLAQADDVTGTGANINVDVIAQDDLPLDPGPGDVYENLGDHIVEGKSDEGESLLQLHYGYGVTIVDGQDNPENNGLWLSYQLKEVGIYDGKSLVLDPSDKPDTTTPGVNGYTFRAQITEVDDDSIGGLEIHKTVGLANAENAFRGETTVYAGGQLYALADNVLGQAEGKHTSALNLAEGAHYELNGYSQTIGSLFVGKDGYVNLETTSYGGSEEKYGELTIENGGIASSDNALQGTGSITLESGVFEVGGDNANLGGTVTIGVPQIETVSNDAGDGDASETQDFVATAVIHDSNGFGSSDIVFADKTSLLYMDNVKSVEESAVFDNRLKGEGTVRADATDVIVTGDNTGFTGTWQIGTGENYAGADDAGNHKFEGTAEASTMRFTELTSLGGTAEAGWADFEIGAGSTLVLGIGQSYKFENVTSGEGGVTIDAGYTDGIANVVELGSNFAHTGLTHVVSGGIRSTGDMIVDEPGSGEGGEGGESGADNGTSGDDPVVGTLPADGPAVGQLPVDTGDSDDGTGADDAASSRTTLMGDVQLDEGTFMEGFAGVNGTLTNAGTVYVNWKRYADEALGRTSSTVYDDAHAHTLKIAGDYVGEGGTLVFNGALAGDDSPVDTIEVAGSASGTGKVQVHNLGGKGDLTSPHGITLITIEGDSTLNLSQDGRIVAGAYDYVLLRDPDSRRFYLQSTAGEYPIPPDVPIGPLVRPEAGAYMAASLAANLAEMRLHDRAGESHYVDPLTGEVKETSMWMRQTGTHAHFRSAGETLRTHMTGGVTQLGGDIIRRSGEGDVRANLGLFGTALYAKSSTRSTLSSHSADTSSDGYTVGVYATLFNGQGERLDQGGYLDLWAQYAWLDHEIRPKELATEEVDADGVIASVEAGWTFQLGTTGKNTSHAVDWSLQPQFQAIYEGVKLDEHVETEGTRVEMTGEGNVKTRLGFRLQASPESQPGERRGQGFLEFNWIHNTKTVGVEMDGVEVESKGMKDAGEVRIGFEGELTENLHGWISGGYLAGGSGYHEETVNVGLKYLW